MEPSKKIIASIAVILAVIVVGGFFFLTIPIASAQTINQTRPGNSAVDNVRSIERSSAQSATQDAIQFNTQNEKEESVLRAGDVRTISGTPRSFLQKARDTLIQKRNALKDQLREETAATTTIERGEGSFLPKQVEERIRRFLSNAERKMNAAIERLEILGERVTSRTDKFEERGIDTSDARKLLDIARESIAEAREKLSVAIEEARIAFESDSPKTTFGEVVSTLAGAKENLREAHQSLIQVVQALKGGGADMTTKEDGAENTSSGD